MHRLKKERGGGSMIQSKNGEVIFTRTERIEYRFNYTMMNILAKAKFNRAFDLLAPKEKMAIIKMLLPKGEKEK